jgi:large subunit ribosomal protein L17
MRHKSGYRKIGRVTSHRMAMFRNMAVSLLEHGCIKTTLPKAKELRGFIEPLVTLAKENTLNSKRRIFSSLRSRSAVEQIHSLYAVKFMTRPGGYTRVLKCGFRSGDAAPMAIVSFVE